MTLPVELDIFKNKVLLIGDEIMVKHQRYEMLSSSAYVIHDEYNSGCFVSSFSYPIDDPLYVLVSYQKKGSYTGGQISIHSVKLVTDDPERLDRFNKFIELLAMSKI